MWVELLPSMRLPFLLRSCLFFPFPFAIFLFDGTNKLVARKQSTGALAYGACVLGARRRALPALTITEIARVVCLILVKSSPHNIEKRVRCSGARDGGSGAAVVYGMER